MGTDKNIRLAEDVLALVKVKQRAEAEGLSVDEAPNQAMRIGLEEGQIELAISNSIITELSRIRACA
jgi:hypothetical protein